MKKKKSTKRYKRVCANHPRRTANLEYIYNGGPGMADLVVGQLLCPQCIKEKSWETQTPPKNTYISNSKSPMKSGQKQNSTEE